MATKKSKKKKLGSKKKKKTGGSPQPLSVQLRNEVITTLKYWQINFGRSGIRQMMIDLLKPSSMHTQFLQWMVARDQTYYGIIKTAKNNGKTYPFVIPSIAALAFETMFDSCAAFWLAAGEPPAVDQLKPSVLDFIDFEVGVFTATVGSS